MALEVWEQDPTLPTQGAVEVALPQSAVLDLAVVGQRHGARADEQHPAGPEAESTVESAHDPDRHRLQIVFAGLAPHFGEQKFVLRGARTLGLEINSPAL